MFSLSPCWDHSVLPRAEEEQALTLLWYQSTSAPGFQCLFSICFEAPQLTERFFLFFPCSLGFQMDENKGLSVPERDKGDDFKLHQVLMEEVRDSSSQAVQHHTPEKS